MAGSTPREDFASAAMMRLVIAGLRRQGFDPEARVPAEAHVPLGDKRDLLDCILETHGPKAILSISDALPHMPAEPTLRALTCAATIPDLLERWHRLETFSHSRHTVSVEPLAHDAFKLTHHARDGGAGPSQPETLLVVATITVLAEMIGTKAVQLKNHEDVVLRAHGSWQDVDVTQVSLMVLTGRKLAAKHLGGQEQSRDFPVSALREKIIADPLNRWTVEDLATQSGLSKRTLQRRLREQNTSFSRLVAESRLEVAAEHLCKPEGPGLAEIGFLAGYADQAHFARSFSSFVGTTPRAYRESFQAPA